MMMGIEWYIVAFIIYTGFAGITKAVFLSSNTTYKFMNNRLVMDIITMFWPVLVVLTVLAGVLFWFFPRVHRLK